LALAGKCEGLGANGLVGLAVASLARKDASATPPKPLAHLANISLRVKGCF